MAQEFPPFPRDSHDPFASDSIGRSATRELEADPLSPAARTTPVVLRSPPNWTGIIFFLALGLLHLGFATSSFVAGHPEGYLSLFFGSAFSLISLACWLATFELAVLPMDRRVRLRTGYRRFRLERFIPFEQVRAVRLTLSPNHGNHDSRIELLCRDRDVECPATSIPRQEALYLALALNVRLIKVCDDLSSPAAEDSDPRRL